MHCYESFGWTPATILELDMHEATLLSVYFEELSRYQKQQQNKHTTDYEGSEYRNDAVIGADDDDWVQKEDGTWE